MSKLKLHIGDTVEVLDDAIKGKVIKLLGNGYLVATEDGFEMEFYENELVKVSKETDLEVTNFEVAQAVKEKQKGIKTKRKSPKMEKVVPAMEVDLHIHKLTESTRGMTNFDMLNLQVDTAKHKLEFAIKNRIQKVVFIHGVGEGVLKTELEYLFGRYSNATYYDADYRTYGLGATEVYIYQNGVQDS
ncbi:DNA mismatch repair protein MutS [Galbibacter sp. BG1]|uniref:Smr/MutS family protein n=1 Tax=Galbibacter sp. BG1 TaxID=1170699 RepID=UPI0015BB2B0F|nr:DNA mismatch repair protein MutS [Galbibacter sp. BG1]QLE00098.1 DNA mismatch repair protein MutS [Galbibacter sp. BG1]